MEFKRSRSSSKLATNNNQTNNPFNKYQLGQLLGQGQFGKVYKAYIKDNKFNTTTTSNNGKSINNSRSFNSTSKSNVYQKNGKQLVFAAKIIQLGKLKKNPKLKQLLTNQIQILSTLKHRNIIRFQQLFIWEDKIYMIYQYCQGGDLQDILPLQQNTALRIFSKIIQACSFAEKNNILHRDLKPANILFRNGQPKVADWGFSRYLKEELTATSFVGSPAYMAPQLLKGSQYTNKADVWSFGVMVYQCLFNEMPWPAKTIKDLLQKLNIIPLRFPKQIMPILKTILKLCLQVDPDKRASFKKLQKIIQLSLKNVKTQQQNPEQDDIQHNQLSPSDIRKCSYYLQFAKQAQKFQDLQTKNLCFQFILNNLKTIKKVNFQYKKYKSKMTPCLSQRQMSHIKRQATSPKTSSKMTKRQQRNSYEKNQTYLLLDKQILLIQKIKQTFANSNSLQSSAHKAYSSFASHTTKSSQPQQHYSYKTAQKLQIKKLLKKLIKNITLPTTTTTTESQKQSPKNKNLSTQKYNKLNRKQLIEMNCILEVIMFEQLADQVKNKKLSEKIREMEDVCISALVRSVNHKILYINQHYCR